MKFKTNQPKTRYAIKFLFTSMLSFLFCAFAYSQNPTLISPKIKHDKDRPLVDNIYTEVEGDSIKKPFTNVMLNILFSNKVGTAFGGSNDLSLNKYFASVDETDKSISLGINFDSRFGEETKKLTWVFSGSLKFKSANKFATIYDKDGVFQKDNIGATIKTTWIGRGIINYKSNDSKKRLDAIANFRKVNYKKYDDIVAKYNKDELPTIKKNLTEAQKYDEELEPIDSLLQEKHDELYIELAKDEIEFLEDNSMYRYLWDHWLSLEAFLPFGKNTYNVTSDTTIAFEEERFYAFNLSLSYNTMWQWSNGQSLFVKAIASIRNNNNILVNDISSKSFQTTLVGANGEVIINNSDDVYIADFKQFETPSITIEPAYFFWSNNTFDLGVSPLVEFNFGDYDKTNWKLGIPISLKDKEGKPKINFEFQWREQNTFTSNIHTVGLSTSFLFGDLIN